MICDVLLRLGADVLCLQEFDFAPKTEGFTELYRMRLGGVYDMYLKQRTGSKDEGLALLMRKGIFEDVEVQPLDLDPAFCDRVALVATARHSATGRQLLVANTHLTVAHAKNTHDIPMCRPLQMQQVLDAAAAAGDSVLSFLCADMNCDHLETQAPTPWSGCPEYSAADVSKPVRMAFECGFVSALHELIPSIRPLSHTSDYTRDGCVDYIFYRPNPILELADAFLHPGQLKPDTAWSPECGWGPGADTTLSDHRPLIADFLLQPLGGEQT